MEAVYYLAAVIKGPSIGSSHYCCLILRSSGPMMIDCCSDPTDAPILLMHLMVMINHLSNLPQYMCNNVLLVHLIRPQPLSPKQL